MVQSQVAIFLAADHGQIFDQVHGRTTVEGDQLGTHERDHYLSTIITVNFAGEYGQRKSKSFLDRPSLTAANSLPSVAGLREHR